MDDIEPQDIDMKQYQKNNDKEFALNLGKRISDTIDNKRCKIYRDMWE
jgi:hypothetical protein